MYICEVLPALPAAVLTFSHQGLCLMPGTFSQWLLGFNLWVFAATGGRIRVYNNPGIYTGAAFFSAVSILGNTLMGSSLSVGSSENVDIWGKSQSSSLDVNWYVHIYILSYIWISHTHAI